MSAIDCIALRFEHHMAIRQSETCTLASSLAQFSLGMWFLWCIALSHLMTHIRWLASETKI